MKNWIHKALTVCGLVGLISAQVGKISVNTQTRQMQDESGRAVLFHGVNMVYKIPPYIPSNGQFDAQFSLTDKEIDQLKEWGFNFVRLGVMWEAVESAPGVYNDAYLDQIEALINKLGQRGIYTLVDAHQDVLARRICGEGMPDFYAKDSDMPHVCEPGILPYLFPFLNFCKSIKDYHFRYDGNGNPLIEDCQSNNFVDYYFSPESMDLFEKLYKSGPTGYQDTFISFWVHVAKRFAGNQYVVGFDPINEPFPSNIYKDASLFYEPGRFEKVTLQPMYKRILNEAYLPADASKLMFFEPT
jgi:endoglycosylceramidase